MNGRDGRESQKENVVRFCKVCSNVSVDVEHKNRRMEDDETMLVSDGALNAGK